jgi:nickel/cobalt transporter (NicO) family protein
MRRMVCLVYLFVLSALLSPVWANPFGVPAGAEKPPGASWAWLVEWQQAFQSGMMVALRALDNDPSALWQVLVLAFVYGVLHAAGPGHGKAVIASYLLAERAKIGRGVILSFVSALMQAFVAIALISFMYFVIGASAAQTTQAAYVLEIISAFLILMLGLYLVLRAIRTDGPWTGADGPRMGQNGPRMGEYGPSALSDTNPSAVSHHGVADAGGHVHGSHCAHGCAHHVAPSHLSETWSRRDFIPVLAAGLRPCTGALLLLVFAFSRGVPHVGIAGVLAMALGTALTVATLALLTVASQNVMARLAARGGGRFAGLLMRGVELAAGLFVVLIGALMMLGASGFKF